MTTPTHRWHHLTPDRFVIGLLVAQVLLLLSARFEWFPFNERKGWTVLIADAVVGVAVAVMLLWGLVCLCLRRRFQFGVRSLLLFMVTVSIPLGWFAWELEKARRQREAVEAIASTGGRAHYNQLTSHLWLWWLVGPDFFCDVVQVDCDFSVLGDDNARHLQELKNLKSLNLGGSDFTDKGMKHLGDLTQLRVLYLWGTEVTDEGMKYVVRLTNLRTLSLDDTQVTDKGLEQLERLTDLEELWLRGTQATNKGVRKLQETLPNCKIIH